MRTIYSVRLGYNKTHLLSIEVRDAIDIKDAIDKAIIAWKKVFEFTLPNRILVKGIKRA